MYFRYIKLARMHCSSAAEQRNHQARECVTEKLDISMILKQYPIFQIDSVLKPPFSSPHRCPSQVPASQGPCEAMPRAAEQPLLGSIQRAKLTPCNHRQTVYMHESQYKLLETGSIKNTIEHVCCSVR